MPAHPVHRRATPAEREDTEEDLPSATSGAVARGGEIGNQADVPEHDRDDEIGQHGPDVPFERTSELRPHAHSRGVRKHPVEEPRPAKMQDRIDRGAYDS